jgi:hypothetical protein
MAAFLGLTLAEKIFQLKQLQWFNEADVIPLSHLA